MDSSKLKQWGATLIFIGAGSFILPMIGFQFRLLNVFGGGPAAGIFIAAVGGILFGVASMKERKQRGASTKPLDSETERQVPVQTVSRVQSSPTKCAYIRCSACDRENAQGDQFCGSCGIALPPPEAAGPPSCSRCGASLSAEERFCGECGEPTVGQPSASEPQKTVPQSSVTPVKSKRVGLVFGTIAVLALAILYYVKQENTPEKIASAPRTTADQLQKDAQKTRAASAPASTESADALPPRKSSSVPPATQIGPFRPQTSQHLPPLTTKYMTEGAPVRGSTNAPVTVVEFSNFECSFCKKAQPTLSQLMVRYRGKIKLVFRDLLSENVYPQARQAAEAARCAKDQGRFWEYHDLLFKQSPRLSRGDLKNYAAEVGLNRGMFESCVSSGKHEDAVRNDSDEGMKLGISGTPAFFINGRAISGAQPLEAFVRMIDEELAHVSSARQ